MNNTAKAYNHNSNTNQEIKRRFVDREVVYCVSMMVHEVTKQADNFPEWADDLYGAYEGYPDYEEALTDNGWEQYEDEFGVECWKNEDGETWAGDAEEVCMEFNIDVYEYAPEVFEHWIVSGYLAERLQAHGEKVIEDILGVGPIWCRTCTGQAILLDHVISEICEEMEILEGMANEWKV